jgi:hypothetical protein
MWVLESTTIAVDQWYGHAAAPASPVAAAALVPEFAALGRTVTPGPGPSADFGRLAR